MIDKFCSLAAIEQEPNEILQSHVSRWNDVWSNGHVDVEVNVVLGTGDVNIEAIVKAGVNAGIKHYFIEDESSRQLEQVPESVKYLKTIKF